MRDGLEDPLDSMDEVLLQLKQFSVIARCEFEKTSTFLLQCFDPVFLSLEQVLALGVPDPAVFRVLDGQMTWLILLTGATIGARRTISAQEIFDVYDAELISRVIKVMTMLNARLTQGHCDSEHIEFAIINFIHNFRLSFNDAMTSRYAKM